MRNIPTVTRNLLIVNVLAFLLCTMASRIIDLNDLFGLHFFLAPDFQIYQLFTYMFMHGGWSHLFFNMFALWMFGCVVENTWGPKKFLVYYLVCGIGAGFFQEAAQLVQFWTIAADNLPTFSTSDTLVVARANAPLLNAWTTVGASGAIYGILLAFGMIYPNERIFIFPLPVPIKAKWFVMLYAGVEIYMALLTSGDGVAHLAHLGGMAFGYFLIRYWRRHPGVGYGPNVGRQFFDGLRSSWERRRGSSWNNNSSSSSSSWNTRQSQSSQTNTHNADWDYNARRKAEQEEIDRILEKIRRSGYDSLTREEKQRLFDNSRK